MTTAISPSHHRMLSRFMDPKATPSVTLFTSPSYCTRHYMGLTYSTLLLCESPSDTACGHCPQCTALSRTHHVDFIHITDTERIKIDRIRQIQDSIKHGPVSASRFIVLIDHGELLTEQAANACLKMFESPPDTVHFILLLPHQSSILSTIVSRSHTISVPPFSADQLTTYLSRYHPDTVPLFSSFTKLPPSLKSHLADLVLTQTDITPLSFTKFIKQSPIDDFNLAESWSKNPATCRFYLLYWMEELWFFKDKLPQSIAIEELLIEIISNMTYTINLKLHLEALFQDIRSLFGT